MSGKRLYAMLVVTMTGVDRSNRIYWGLFGSRAEAEGVALQQARSDAGPAGRILTSAAYQIEDALVLEAAALIRREGGAA